MEYQYAAYVVAFGLFLFLAFELGDVLKAFAKSKSEAAKNNLAIEREKTEQEKLKNERIRLESSKFGKS